MKPTAGVTVSSSGAPTVLGLAGNREIYVTAALAGSVIFVAMVVGFGLDIRIAGASGFICCFAARGFALQFGWSLPTYKSQPGRTQEELEELGVLSKDDEG